MAEVYAPIRATGENFIAAIVDRSKQIRDEELKIMARKSGKERGILWSLLWSCD